jgi:ubiquinone/menaquinone biosynthesis C-methylase UbiE
MASDSVDYLRLHLQTVPAFRALVRGIECRLFAELGTLEDPVLDVGCGDGHFASMAFKTAPFVGFDLDHTILKEAASRHVYKCVLNASATELPFTAAIFPTVVSNSAIEHIPDLDRTLAEINRVLSLGGRFIFSVPSPYFAQFLLGSALLRKLGANGLAENYGHWFENHSHIEHSYCPDVWEQKLAAHGFEIISWQYYMSAAAHRAFDLLHYLGLPNLISRKLTGRWVLWPPLSIGLLERWLRPYYEAVPPEQGAFIFFDIRKMG